TMIANLELEAKALFLRTRNNTPVFYTKLASAKTNMKVALRSCDTITVNLPIPTVLGVVARLLVQDLLKYKTGQQR
ncbi:35149_t:CDS:2, partial [Racocetra persica]